MAVRSWLRPLGRELELPNLTESYLLTCRAEGKSPNTIRWYEQKLRALYGYLCARRLPLSPEGLTPEIVRGLVVHLQATGVSAFTTRAYAQVVKGLFTWLENEGYIAEHHPLVRTQVARALRLPLRPTTAPKPRRPHSQDRPRAGRASPGDRRSWIPACARESWRP